MSEPRDRISDGGKKKQKKKKKLVCFWLHMGWSSDFW